MSLYDPAEKAFEEKHHFSGEEDVFKGEDLIRFHESLSLYFKRAGQARPEDGLFIFRKQRTKHENWDGLFELFYIGEDVPEIFDDGIVLGLTKRKPPELFAREIADRYAILNSKKESLEKQFDLAKKVYAKKLSNQKIKEYELTAYGVTNGSSARDLTLIVMLDAIMLNDACQPTGMKFVVPVGKSSKDWKNGKELNKHLTAQKDRQKVLKSGDILIDVISAALIGTMNESDFNEFCNYVRSDEIPDNAKDAEHTYVQYKRNPNKSFKLPDMLTRIHLSNGHVHTRVDFGGDTLLRDGIISLPKIDLPIETLGSLKGKTARSVLNSDWIPEKAKIVEVRHKDNRTHMYLDVPETGLSKIEPKGIPESIEREKESEKVAKARAALMETAQVIAQRSE